MDRLGRGRAHVLIAGVAAAVAAAEWLHGDSAAPAGWAWGAAGAAVVALAAWVIAGAGSREKAPRGERARLGAAVAASLGLGVVLVVGAQRIRRVECCWAALREQRVADASRLLATSLAGAVTEARRLAERGATAALVPRESRFAVLRAAMRRGPADLERGVVLDSADGSPLAWAGRHRTVPANDTTELRADITPFYVSLHARRQTPDGGSAIGTVLLDAAPAAPDRQGAFADRFARAHGVTLRFYAPGLAPPDSDVSDFCYPACRPANPAARVDTLFSVRPQPPEQGDAKLEAWRSTARIGGGVLAVALLLLLAAAPPGRWRWVMLLTGAWVLTRAPVSSPIPLAGYFDPNTFYRPVLLFFGTSAGSLTVAGGVLLLATGALWRRGVRRRWWWFAGAAVLLVAAPYLVRYFGRGITPPANGVSFGLWLAWEVALALGAMALILLAAALVRGSAEPTRVPWTVPAACAWAVLAAAAGLWLWQPYGAWPEWYTFVWLPALAGAIVPAPRRWALAGIAIVAGTAAALVTWGAAVEGRLSRAMRDAQHLGRVEDALARAQLERFGQELPEEMPPRSAADLYGLWVRSPLANEYPAALGLWSPEGRPLAELRLAELEDLPDSLLAALARSERDTTSFRVERLARIPGIHYVLVARLASGDRLTVGVGPRSGLLQPDRVARFLRGERSAEPLYTISLALARPSEPLPPATLHWTRVGWTAQGDRWLELPDGGRHVHVRVDLRGPWPLLVRGALAVFVDVVLLGAVWLLMMFVSVGEWPRPPSLIAAVRLSYRARLTAALVGFFVLPVLGFTALSVARLRNDARQDGDLLISQTLRDAAAMGASMDYDRPSAMAGAVVDLSTRHAADLWLYRGGRLMGSSAPVLEELGLVDPFLSLAVFERLALEDETEVTVDDRLGGRPIRVGYQVVRASPPQAQVILAAPQLLDDERVRQQEEDLALVLILTTLIGLLAAVYLAGLAARTLERPVAALRDAALAVGRGATPPAFPPGAPRELEPVLSAFDRMVADVRRSQDALEEARRRTAQVLANVATGVVAVDPELRVTMANPRAEELLGTDLAPGDFLTRSTSPVWAPVWQAVTAFLAAPPAEIVEREFEIAGRQIRVQLASLGPSPDGCVVALDDATALARASRVLAWGEMARQVAHEIKNPLTPIRLGIQHLLRARTEVGGGGRKKDFDATLRETAERILTEIDRLDGIARAFSRFGAPAEEQAPLEPVDLLAVAREVVQLYGLGHREPELRCEVQVDGAEPGDGRPVSARRDEVKEVLVNLLENSRNAGARQVTVRVFGGGRVLSVEDDGRGIPAEELPRVFEPAFSTTSSGSGLGLAIARRLVESWGGTITLTSVHGGSGAAGPPGGTTVVITFRNGGQ